MLTIKKYFALVLGFGFRVEASIARKTVPNGVYRAVLDGEYVD